MKRPGSELSYVLVTPARNEQDLIEGTIRSVVAQTHRPLAWIIVSDGSTDRTDDIVADYVSRHSWIELLRMPEHRDRSFAAKAACFNAGYERLKSRAFDVIGNLDADITFEPEYCAFLLSKFAEMPRLGVAGTPYIEDAGKPDSHAYDHDVATSSMFPVPARCSGDNASTRSVDTRRSRVAASTGSRSRPRE